jgi:hypothetical protein
MGRAVKGRRLSGWYTARKGRIMKLRTIILGTAIAAFALSGAGALAAGASSLPQPDIHGITQPVKVRPNSSFSISGFVGARPVDPKGGTFTFTAIRGHGNRPTVTVKEDKHKAFKAKLRAGDGRVVQYRVTFKLAGWRSVSVKTKLIEVSK